MPYILICQITIEVGTVWSCENILLREYLMIENESEGTGAGYDGTAGKITSAWLLFAVQKPASIFSVQSKVIFVFCCTLPFTESSVYINNAFS